MLFAEKIDMILFSSPLGFSPLNRDGKLVTFTSELWSCNDLYWIWLQTAHCPFTTLDPYTRHYKIRQIIFQYCNFFYPLHREQKPELTAPQIRLNLHLVRSSGQSEAKNDTLLPTMIAIASPKACLLLISISMYSISARKNKRSTKLSTRKRCSVRQSCGIDQKPAPKETDKLFNAARATADLFLLLHGLTLSVKETPTGLMA